MDSGVRISEEWLLSNFASMLFAHNYYGTCISGEKRHRFPTATTCSRIFGWPCVPLYWSRGCGPLRPAEFARSYALQRRRAALLCRYRAIVVASEHMRAEFERHGLRNVKHLPLFVAPPISEPLTDGVEGPLLFIGRLAATKGVELMLESVRIVRQQLRQALPLVLLGDGSLRLQVDRTLATLGEDNSLRGWVTAAERDNVLRFRRGDSSFRDIGPSHSGSWAWRPGGSVFRPWHSPSEGSRSG